MAATAVDGQVLGTQDGNAQAAWAGRAQDWINAHNAAIGFTSNPDEMFQTINGVRSITQIGVELWRVGYTGPWDRGSLIAAYARTAGGTVMTYSAAPVQPTLDHQGGTQSSASRYVGAGGTLLGGGSPTVGGVSIVGNPWQWLKQSTRVLGIPLPNWALAGGVGYFFLGRRRR